MFEETLPNQLQDGQLLPHEPPGPTELTEEAVKAIHEARQSAVSTWPTA